MTRPLLLAFFAALWLSAPGCSSNDDDSGPAGNAGQGGTSGSSGAGTGGTAGAAGVAGAAGTAGQAGAAGSAGAAGQAGAAGAAGSAGTGGSGPADPCALPAGCTAVDKECVGWADNSTQSKPGLRMSQLSLKTPTIPGLLETILANAISQNAHTCNQIGAATSNWLFQFDTTAGTLRTGGARSVTDPASQTYSFLDETISGIQIAPLTLTAQLGADGSFSTSQAGDLVMPFFLDPIGTESLLLPIRQFRITSGKLSASRNCIGSYNSAGLVPTDCLPDADHPGFIDGSSFEGYTTLEDADTVPVPQLAQTLCVILSGDPAQYGDGSAPLQKCKRDSNAIIVYKGDWCGSTNAPADGSCADAVRVSGSFAASSVRIQ